MSTLDPLLEPFDLNNVRLRNRVVSTSHEPAYGEDGMPTDRYRLYHVEKARGGVGLTMIGGSAVVSRDSPPVFNNLLLYRDDIVPWLRRLADDVHDEGAAVMCQVTHLGRRTTNFSGDWLPAVYPSPLREPAHRSFPKVAEDWDLERIICDYVSAAQRCQAGGLDGIELQAYGHLLDAFLSPVTNWRDDKWGGSLENRMRFARRVITGIREAVGPDFVVGIRMMMDEDRPDGLQRDEALEALRHYVNDGIDFLSVIKGSIESDATLSRVIPSMGEPSAPFLDFSAQIKQAVDVPVMHASRIADVATARYAIRENLLDLVGMTRAQIADPHLVRKLAAGQEDRIRPCVGASYCLDAIYQSGATKCIHNPSTGREQELPHLVPPASAVRKAVVVGAGPAGLEAARVLGERGHHVTVLEANTAPGGQLATASRSPRRRDIEGIVDWRVSEAKHLGVDLRLGVYAEPADVLAERPDVVIVATGGLPNRSFLTDGDDLVVDSWDVLDGTARVSGDVLLYDDNGGFPGMDAAEVVAPHCRLEFLTPERTVAPDVGGMNSPAYLKVFAENDVRTTLGHQLRGVSRAADGRLTARLFSEYSGQESERTVDHVVVDHGTLPNDDVYHELTAGSSNLGEVDIDALLGLNTQEVRTNPGGEYQLFRIGDAVASRNIHAAVLDAYRLCIAL